MAVYMAGIVQHPRRTGCDSRKENFSAYRLLGIGILKNGIFIAGIFHLPKRLKAAFFIPKITKIPLSWGRRLVYEQN